MKKKIFILVIVFAVLAIAGSIFYYWQSQKQVWALNKTLPKEVRVGKSIFGNKYKVVNKIDGYEFKVPSGWEGIEEIEYMAERGTGVYKGTSIFAKGKTGGSRTVSVDTFKMAGGDDKDLNKWATDFLSTFKLSGDLNKKMIAGLYAISTREVEHLAGAYIYFIKSANKIYILTGGSEEYIKQIINSGKW